MYKYLGFYCFKNIVKIFILFHRKKQVAIVDREYIDMLRGWNLQLELPNLKSTILSEFKIIANYQI